MTKTSLSALLVLAGTIALSAQAVPDLSGRWNRDAASGGDAVGGPGWGPRVEITQATGSLTVQRGSERAERYRLDGSETAEVIALDGCRNEIRITKAGVDRDRVTISTWLVTKTGCSHRETEDEPLIGQTGAIALFQVIGARKLESITVVSRDGAALLVETTRAVKGGPAASTSTTYRR